MLRNALRALFDVLSHIIIGDPFMPRKLLVGKATLNKLKSR